MSDQTYKTEAHFDFGQHIDLSRLMLDQMLLADSTIYGFAQKAAVAFVKATDDMITDAIIKKAKENGITDLYVLNEDFILAAIREKMERESERPHGHWEWFDEESGNPIDGQEREWGWSCSACKDTLKDEYDDPDNPPRFNYCPNCGTKMDDPKGG